MLHHIALQVDKETQEGIERRLTEAGYQAPKFYVLEHGYCKSVYAEDPNGMICEFTVDHPLVRRTTGRWLANFPRLEVPGSPAVGWVRVVVTPGAAQPFAFQPLVVPRWKFW